MVTGLTTLDVVNELALLEAAVGARELERPQERVRDLEVGASGGNLVDKVLNRDDAVLAKMLLNDAVVRDRDALTVDLGEATLVNKLADGLEVGLTPSHVGSDHLEHLLGSVGELQENTVVDLDQTQELHDLAGLRGDVANTTQTDNESNTRLSGDVEVALRLGETAQTNLLTLKGLVLLNVLLSTLEDDRALLLPGLSKLASVPDRRSHGTRRKQLIPRSACACRVSPERWYN